jgi:BlaI family penicillinase repressor
VNTLGRLSGRERQILEILYQHGKAAVSEVRGAMEDAPSYSAVRTLIGVLEQKGHVKRRAEGLRYIYSPVIGREEAKRAAVMHLLETYFKGSPEQIVAVLQDISSTELAREKLDGMTETIEEAKGKKRQNAGK